MAGIKTPDVTNNMKLVTKTKKEPARLFIKITKSAVIPKINPNTLNSKLNVRKMAAASNSKCQRYDPDNTHARPAREKTRDIFASLETGLLCS